MDRINFSLYVLELNLHHRQPKHKTRVGRGNLPSKKLSAQRRMWKYTLLQAKQQFSA